MERTVFIISDQIPVSVAPRPFDPTGTGDPPESSPESTEYSRGGRDRNRLARQVGGQSKTFYPDNSGIQSTMVKSKIRAPEVSENRQEQLSHHEEHNRTAAEPPVPPSSSSTEEILLNLTRQVGRGIFRSSLGLPYNCQNDNSGNSIQPRIRL